METSKRNYLPLLLAIITLNILVIGAVLIYLNQPRTERIQQGEQLPSADTAIQERAEENRTQEATGSGVPIELEVFKIDRERVVLSSGKGEISLTRDMFVVEESKKLKKGMKVELSRPIVGAPLIVRVIE